MWIRTYVLMKSQTGVPATQSLPTEILFTHTDRQTDRQINVGREIDIVKSKYKTKCLIFSIKIVR